MLSPILIVVLFILNTAIAQERYAQTIPSTVRLLNEDYDFPLLGLGTAALGGDLTYNIVVSAIEQGIRMIDTAQAKEWYDEKEVGKALQYIHSENKLLKQSHIITVTKVHPRDFELNKMRNAVHLSLSNLKHTINTTITSLDIVLLHSPYCWQGHCTQEEERVTWQTGWRNLEILKKEGLIDHIGVSNFDVRLLGELLSFTDSKVSVIQVRYNILYVWLVYFPLTHSYMRIHILRIELDGPFSSRPRHPPASREEPYYIHRLLLIRYSLGH